MKESFRLTMNGGHIIATGTLYTVALNALAQPNITLYVRSLNDPSVVAEIRNHMIVFTRFGSVIDTPPEWGPKLSQLLKGAS